MEIYCFCHNNILCDVSWSFSVKRYRYFILPTAHTLLRSYLLALDSFERRIDIFFLSLCLFLSLLHSKQENPPSGGGFIRETSCIHQGKLGSSAFLHGYLFSGLIKGVVVIVWANASIRRGDWRKLSRFMGVTPCYWRLVQFQFIRLLTVYHTSTCMWIAQMV